MCIFLCATFLLRILSRLLYFLNVAHKHLIHYFSASECKPCSQPCGPPIAQLSVQPPASSGAGSYSSLSPASVAEDVFFDNADEDQVKQILLHWEHFINYI